VAVGGVAVRADYGEGEVQASVLPTRVSADAKASPQLQFNPALMAQVKRKMAEDFVAPAERVDRDESVDFADNSCVVRENAAQYEVKSALVDEEKNAAITDNFASPRAVNAKKISRLKTTLVC